MKRKKKNKHTHTHKHRIINTLKIKSFWKRYGYLCDASGPRFNLPKKKN